MSLTIPRYPSQSVNEIYGLRLKDVDRQEHHLFGALVLPPVGRVLVGQDNVTSLVFLWNPVSVLDHGAREDVLERGPIFVTVIREVTTRLHRDVPHSQLPVRYAFNFAGKADGTHRLHRNALVFGWRRLLRESDPNRQDAGSQ